MRFARFRGPLAFAFVALTAYDWTLGYNRKDGH